MFDLDSLDPDVITALATHTDETSEEAREEGSTEDQVRECLEAAGGESLSLQEIVDSTGLRFRDVLSVLRELSTEDIQVREVFEDENQPNAFFLTTPMLDRLAF